MHEVLEHAQQGIKDLDDLLTRERDLHGALPGHRRHLSAEQAIDYGLQRARCCARPACRGTCARTSRTRVYDRFNFEIPVGNYGDVYDRYLVRVEEMRQSISIIEQALEQLPPDGPIVPEKHAAPAAHASGRGVPAQSRRRAASTACTWCRKGGDKPYRLKMRSPSFCNLSALRDMTIGQYMADAVMILGSMDIVLCEVDR